MKACHRCGVGNPACPLLRAWGLQWLGPLSRNQRLDTPWRSLWMSGIYSPLDLPDAAPAGL